MKRKRKGTGVQLTRKNIGFDSHLNLLHLNMHALWTHVYKALKQIKVYISAMQIMKVKIKKRI